MMLPTTVSTTTTTTHLPLSVTLSSLSLSLSLFHKAMINCPAVVAAALGTANGNYVSLAAVFQTFGESLTKAALAAAAATPTPTDSGEKVKKNRNWNSENLQANALHFQLFALVRILLLLWAADQNGWSSKNALDCELLVHFRAQQLCFYSIILEH